MSEMTRLLLSIEHGDGKAAEELPTLIYNELRKIASAKMAGEQPGQTLQPTALVHEAWLRLGGDAQPTWQNRAHFFGAAAEAMRRILVDRARRKKAQRRGAGAAHLDVTEVDISGLSDSDQLLAINEALDKLALDHPQKAELVKLRYFVGLTFDEVAPMLGIAIPTAKEWWAYARAWLAVEIRGLASRRSPVA